jgi:hypothetical protein
MGRRGDLQAPRREQRRILVVAVTRRIEKTLEDGDIIMSPEP